MKTVSTEGVGTDWRALVGDASAGPVKVVSDDNASMIVMSEAEFERLKGGAWTRLFAAMDKMSSEAAAAGLTEEKLAELLADES